MLRQHWTRSAVSLAVYCLALFGTASAAAPSTLQWQTNLEEAKRIAAQSNRLVLVHFWSPSCKPCMELEKNVFSQPQVQQFIESRFVPIKINADDAPTTTKHYGISRLPTDLIITPGQQIVGRLTCPMTADAYLQQLSIATNGAGPSVASPAAGYAAAPVGYGTGSPPYPSVPPAGSYLPATLAPSAMATPPVSAPGSWAAVSPAPPVAVGAVPNTNAVAHNTTPPASTGFSTQWSPPNSNPAVSEAYSDNRYSEFFQRYATASSPAPGTSPANAPTMNNLAGGTMPPVSISPGYSMPVNSYAAGGNPAMPPAAYGYAATPATMAANMQPPASAAPQLGLDGYSPVALMEQGQWRLGDRRFGAIHRGRTYLFTSPEEQQKFLANPDRFSPTASGDDVVLAVDYGQQAEGKRCFGLTYQNRIYLFSSEATQQAFMQNRERYAAQVQQAENLSRTAVR
ncbi:MAG TPA: thioredoxin family protein [Pirellulales bacterium]